MSTTRTSPISVLVGRRWKQDFWLWVMPVAFFIGGIVFAFVTLQLDKSAAAGTLPLPSWALGGGASEVQSVLDVVAGASISVLTLVFSSALVVLTLAAAQFGSFLVHDFVRLRISRLTLSMFVATFVYSLMILTRAGGEVSQQFVPQISAKVAVLLAIASVGVLIAFIFSISAMVQAQQVAALVAANLRRAIAERQRANAVEGGTNKSEQLATRDIAEAAHHLDEEGIPVYAVESGYLQTVQFRRLVRAAKRAEVVVRLAYRPGQFVLTGSTLAEVWPPERARKALIGQIEHAHVIGSQRTLQQDLEFAVDKLVQIALLALSSAINNTFNALICIDWLADALQMLVEYPCDWLVYRDGRGTVRVITQPLPLTDLIATAFGKVRYASGGNPAVAVHLLRTLDRLAPAFTTAEQRASLGSQADATAEEALKVLTLEEDRSAVMESYRRTCRALGQPTFWEHTITVDPDLPADAP